VHVVHTYHRHANCTGKSLDQTIEGWLKHFDSFTALRNKIA
jgi:hypothetical protein